MISSPWAVPLTVVFVLTGALSLVNLGAVTHRGAEPPAPADRLVEMNHLVMSIAMVAMVWWHSGPAATGVWTVAFVLLGVALVVVGVRQHAGDLMGHALMNAAMVWMLLAMPALMSHGHGTHSGAAHADHADHQGHQGHGGHVPAMAEMTRPIWAAVGNTIAVVAMAALALWWLIRLVRGGNGDRLHPLCHALMAGGMAAMLALM